MDTGGNGLPTCQRRNSIYFGHVNCAARLDSPTRQKTIFSNDDDDESPTTQLTYCAEK